MEIFVEADTSREKFMVSAWTELFAHLATKPRSREGLA